MTPEQKRIAIAEASDYRWLKEKCQNGGYALSNRYEEYSPIVWELCEKPPTLEEGNLEDILDLLPDYLNSLDAMHEAILTLTDAQMQIFWGLVTCGCSISTVLRERWKQRAPEAFLRTIGKWKED